MAIQVTAPDSLPDNEIIQTDFQGKDGEIHSRAAMLKPV